MASKDSTYNNGGHLHCPNQTINGRHSADPCDAELHYTTDNDAAKKSGQIGLYCPQCGVKYHGDVNALKEYATAQKRERREAARAAKEREEETADASA